MPAPRPTGTSAAAANASGLFLPGMGWQLVLALGSMVLLMVLSISLVWAQRDALLDRAQAQAQREVLRLGAELDQSLRLARASMSGLDTESSAPGAGLSDSQRPLILALDLPFALKELPVQPEYQEAPERQWLPGLPRQDNGQWIIPMVWRQSAAEGGRLYELQLAREALLARFASEGMPKDSSMSLFRIEDDGATTVLSRHPLVEREQGMKVHGHLSAALNERPSGVFRATAVVDGIERIVGYQRLAGDAQRLMVVYALGTESVLAPWKALLPWAGLLTFLVMFAMGYGTWRLQRSMRALHDSERHFQTLASHLPDVIARYDRQGRFLYVNPAVESANGRSPEALIGRTITEVGTPEPIAAEWMACLDRVFSSGLSETLYFSYPGPKGMRHWEAQVSLEPPSQGEAQTVLVINRDITERREAQARTLAAQQLFETVFQSAPEAMSLGDWHTGQLLLVNDAFCALFGRTRENLLGHTSLELGLWRTSRGRQDLLEELASGASIREVAGRSTRPDGEEIHVRYSAERVQVDGQDRLLLMFRDVTQLEREQQAAAQEQERLSRFVLMLFRLASRFINLPVHQIDRAMDDALGDVGRFVHAGRAYIFLYDHDNGTASNTHEWCADGVSAQIDTLQKIPMSLVPHWMEAHRIGQRVQIDDVHGLPVGPLRELLESQQIRSLTTLPLMVGEACTGFVGLDWVGQVHEWVDEEMALLELFAQMLVNTQLRTQTEGRLHALTGQLEQMVTERTAQLQESVQRLQVANRELEAFTYSASHDLRTPLRGIEGFSALLLQDHADRLDAQGQDYLKRIQRATLHMSQLITDLLAYARLEQMTGHMAAVDVADLLEKVAQPFLEAVDRRQGQLTWHVQPGLKAQADPRGLSMVLRNLLDNALKFTPSDRHPVVRIEAVQDGEEVLVTVSDNGQGFDMKHHDRIFGMFQRLHRQDQIPGTGIGLAMVAKAMERMGGRIWADSVPGQGSRFHIRVAVHPQSPAPKAPTEVPA
ncbi:PAS domain S-box protein [Hydrogenophaga bisanensis]|uniref:histidine kinase n=1 Tax=Hydrogenophaga bisanensis TaxID=439611 RepID=A0ABW2RD22_9BURK